MSNSHAIGIDLGGTNIRCAVVDAKGRVLHRVEQPTDADRGPDIICTTTTSKTPLYEDADLQPGAQINAVGTHTPYARELNMSDDEVYAGVEKAIRKYFGKRGEQVVQDNMTCVKRGYGEMQEIPASMIHEGNGQA